MPNLELTPKSDVSSFRKIATLMRTRALVAFVVAAHIILPRTARACSVCGCDPSSAILGLDRPAASSLRLGIEDRYLQKESGALHDGSREGEREDRISLRLQYSPPVPRLSLQLEMPIYAWKTHLNVNSIVDDTNRGLGDLALTARYELLRLGGLVPRHTLAVTATVKAPTGNNTHLAPTDGDTFDEHKQIGTGTWDETVGVYYTYGDLPTVLYGGLSARINGTNARGNHYGNALFATIGARRTFLESERLFFALDAQLRNAGRDTAPGSSYDPNSGGLITYATAAAGFALTSDLLVRGTVQAPLHTALYGVQSEHPVAFVAFAYDLAL
jgi:hypothetical protein